MSDFQDLFNVRETEDNTYIANNPPAKSSPNHGDNYGGDIVGQAILVAIKSAPKGFTPHSVHSYFINTVSDSITIEWKVNQISNGNNFCGRNIRALQNGEVMFMSTISLTRRNSLKGAEDAYKDYIEKEPLKKKNGKRKLEPHDDNEEEDDDDDEVVIEKPFHFLAPFPKNLKDSNLELFTDHRTSQVMINHKIPSHFINIENNEGEDNKFRDSRVLWFSHLDAGDIKITDPAFQFTALTVLSDSISLITIARLLQTPNLEINKHHLFSKAMDHIIYFHDTDFDATDWMGFALKVVRLASGRLLLEGQIYNSAYQHVASIFQERIISSIEPQAAKL